MQIGILEKKGFSPQALRILKKIGKVVYFDEKNIHSFIQDKEIIFIRLNCFIGKEFLNFAPKLKFICSPTTGLNHVDVEELKNRNITLVSLRGEHKFLSFIRATPEHALGLTLSLLRNYKYAFLNTENKEWGRDRFKGYEIYNKNAGIIGFGRLGKILAKYFSSFGANVFFYDINSDVKPCFGAKKINNLGKMIKKCKIILLCASYSEEYSRFLDKKYIDLLKNKYFINVSRNELLDENYLIKKIKSNFFKGIALDVITNETGKNNLNRLIKLTKNRNFILTPHVGGATHESMQKTELFIVSKLFDLLKKSGVIKKVMLP